MSGNLTNAMFDLSYIAANVGANIESGGLSVKEEEVQAGEGTVTLTQTAKTVNGSVIGWYKKPTENDWKIGTISAKTMTISGAHSGEKYCVKYFYNNENAKSITINAQYIPKTLHLVIMHELFAGDIDDIGNATKYGRIITDIPRFQLSGSQDLSLSATGAATTSLAGKALAVSSGDSCEEVPYYGTMTQEIYGAKWQDDVIAIAVENGDVTLKARANEILAVRAVFGKGMASQRKDNKNFTFTKENIISDSSGITVGAHDGKIVAGSGAGKCIISVKLDGAPHVEPAYVRVTVSG